MDILLQNYIVQLREKLGRESGQGALEYIAIVIGLVVLLYIGFRIAGVNIATEAGNFVQRILSGQQ